jgi:hypothetical protein
MIRLRTAVVGAVAVVVLASASHHGAAGATTTDAAVPAGSTYTPASWAAALLPAGGWPATACNLGAIEAWESAEGGQWENSAAFNPLNTTQPEPGSWTINSGGVRAYVSWQQGFRATLTTLSYADYSGIRAALSAGDNAQAVADAVAASPWGTEPFKANC